MAVRNDHCGRFGDTWLPLEEEEEEEEVEEVSTR